MTAKVAIVGAGAMGSVYAGLFASAGHDVTVVSRPGAHLEAIRKNGLRVDGASGDRTVAVRAVSTPPMEPTDLIVIAVKATQVGEAVHAVRPMMGADTVILTMQNGLGAADIVARELGGDRLSVGIAAAFGASVPAPGHVHHTGMEAIKLGAYDTLSPNWIEHVETLWRSAGFNAQAVTNIVAMQWEKLICNASFSAPCAITGMTVGEAIASIELGPICLAAGVEAWETARACGIAINVDDPVAHIRAFAARVAAAKPSLLQDVEAKRPSEIDFINGAVPREAQKVGRDAPVNRMLTALVKAIEQRR